LRFVHAASLLALSTLLLAAPAFADNYTVLNSTSSAYTSAADFGGGDGSFNTISSLGPFSFSDPLYQLSGSENMLGHNNVSQLTINVAGNYNVVGFGYQVSNLDPANVSFYNAQGNFIDTISFTDNTSGNDVLVALEDTTPGESISYITVSNDIGNQFMLDNLTVGSTGTSATPEPGSLALFGSGLVGLAGMIRRRRSA